MFALLTLVFIYKSEESNVIFFKSIRLSLLDVSLLFVDIKGIVNNKKAKIINLCFFIRLPPLFFII